MKRWSIWKDNVGLFAYLEQEGSFEIYSAGSEVSGPLAVVSGGSYENAISNTSKNCKLIASGARKVLVNYLPNNWKSLG